MKYLQLFYDGLDSFEYLSDEEAGKLIKSIINYNKGNNTELQGSLNALLVMFKNEIDRTKKEYETKCLKNKANGSLGGRPKTQNNQTVKKETQKTQDKDKDKEIIYIDFYKKFSFVDEISFKKMIQHLSTKYIPLTKVRVSNNIKKLKDNPNLFSLSVDEMIRLDFNGLFIPSIKSSNNNSANLDEITKANLLKNPNLGGYN